MLPRTPAAEIVPGDQDGRVFVSGLIEDEILAGPRDVGAEGGDFVGVVVAKFGEGGESESGALDGLEEFFGDDHVGVDVLDVEGSGDSGEDGEFGESGGCGIGGGS
mmetsp:Transcript_7968/g.16284  ORF Transcript_7968/g.16284 Transcript_7968/m.16284 type:complete len:106 (+) Transcript_7968:554-871(+)